MGERTDPSEALERVAWFLNYHEGDSLSINQIAEATNLSWATAHKYVHTLERLDRISPEITSESGEVTVDERAPAINELFRDEAFALTIFIFDRALSQGDNVTTVVEYEPIADAFDDHEDLLNQIDSLGWVEQSSDGVCLTPQGVRVAGPARSRITNCGD